MTMLFGASESAPLEIRREGGATRLRGRFPYSRMATLSDGGRNGRPRKEVFAPRAFAFRVEDPAADIHLLAGHDYNRPLASKATGSLRLADADDALTFDADITPQIAETSYGADILAGIAAGIAIGLSPGFRIPPKRAVPLYEAEEIIDEPHDPEMGQHNAVIRKIKQALLFELSIVTVAAYDLAQVEMRSWDVPFAPFPAPAFIFKRWRPH